MKMERFIQRKIIKFYYLLPQMVAVWTIPITERNLDANSRSSIVTTTILTGLPSKIYSRVQRIPTVTPHEKHLSLSAIGMDHTVVVFLSASIPVIILAIAVVIYHFYRKKYLENLSLEDNPSNSNCCEKYDDPPPDYEKVVQEFDKLPRYSEVFSKRPASLSIKKKSDTNLPSVHQHNHIYQTKPVTPPPYPGPPLNSCVIHI